MRIAFVGMGTMGAAMALNLLNTGFDVTVHNRTREREIPLERAGANRAVTPADAAANVEIVITCVSDTPDVERVLLGDEGVVHGASEGTLIIDMSTTSPEATVKMAETLTKRNLKMIDAPVSGGSEGAQKGTLAIMVGGAKKDVAVAMPVLEAMGKTITHVGPNGAGQTTKAINQILIAATYLGVAEGVALGMKAGLDMEKVIDAVGGGAAGSWVLTHRSGNMINNEYPLGFRVRHHFKDLRIALDLARNLGVTMPVAALAEQIEAGLIGQGFGDEDVSALARAIRSLSEIT